MGKILFRPTCSKCHKILANREIDILSRIDSLAGVSVKYRMPDYMIQPNCCPYCGEEFEAIIMPETGKFPIDDHDITTM